LKLLTHNAIMPFMVAHSVEFEKAQLEAKKWSMTAKLRPLLLDAFVSLRDEGITQVMPIELQARAQQLHPDENVQRLSGMGLLDLALDHLERLGRVTSIMPKESLASPKIAEKTAGEAFPYELLG